MQVIVVTTEAKASEHPPPKIVLTTSRQAGWSIVLQRNRPHHPGLFPTRGASSSTAVGFRPFVNEDLSSQAPQTVLIASLPEPYAGNRRHHRPASGTEHPPPRIVVTTTEQARWSILLQPARE